MNKEWKQTLADSTEVVRSSAWSPPGCHPVGCGLRLFVKNGKLVKVEGDPEHPLTHGSLCVRCLSLPEYIYHPDRIIYPMKRDRADRGKNKWQRISWDEALDIAATNIRATWEKYGMEGTCFFVGTGRSAAVRSAFQAFNVLQTPNLVYAFSGYSCYGPRIAVTSFVVGAGVPEMDYATGFEDRYDDPRFEIPKYVLVWGKEPTKSNPDGLWGHCLIELMKRGTQLIVVDPRMTWLATRAAHVLRLRPGTDAALALGLLHVIINEDLYDHDFVEVWTTGFEDLVERVQEYPVDKVAAITGVAADKIVAAARALAVCPVSMTWGVSVDECVNGVQAAQALLILSAITGNLDIPGGTLLGSTAGMGAAAAAPLPTMTPPEVMDKEIGSAQYPAFNMTVNACQPDYFLECLEKDEPYPIRMAWIQSSNFLAPSCSAQPKRWHDAMLKMDFTMITDLFMTPTAMALADLFLPVATFAEGKGLVFNHYGMHTTVVSAINKAISVGEAKSDLEIGAMLAKKLYPELYPMTVEEFESEYFDGMAGITGLDWNGLRDAGTALIPSDYRKYESGQLRPDGQPGFNTPSGLLEIRSSLYEMLGEDPLPYYEEPHMSPLTTPEYQFVLTTGARKYSSFHSEHRQIASLRAMDPDPILEINPQAAAALGIVDGDWIVVENKFGSAKLRAQLTAIIKPGVVHATHGWWYPEDEAEEPSLFGTWRSNINQLCPSGDNSVMGFGAPLKNLMCNVRKAEQEG